MTHVSLVTNIYAKELIVSREWEAPVTLNVDEGSTLPRIEFFHSQHAGGVYQAPPTLQFCHSIRSDGTQIAFAVDIKSVEAFAKRVRPLCRKINRNSEFTYDRCNYVYVRKMKDAAKKAAEELQWEFDEFMRNGNWIDQGVVIWDCYEYWTHEELAKLYSPGMDFEDFECAVRAAQEAAESDDFKILGVPHEMIDEVFYDDDET